MKKFIVFILPFLLFSSGAYAQCFIPSWTEPSHEPMFIYVSMATLNGTNLQIGDEIGVFDGKECVGAGVLTEELTGAPVYLVIETSRERRKRGGFKPNHTILYRFCSGGEVVDLDVTPTYISKGPTFAPNDSCVVELRAGTIDINDPPVITSIPVTEACSGIAYSYTIIAEDVDGDPLAYEALVLPGWLSFNPTTHTLSATPGDEDLGDQHVTIRVSDGSLFAEQTFIITVSQGNHAPSFTSDPATSVVVGDEYEYVIRAQDMDSDPLTYTAPLLPDWLTFDPETHAISGVPRSNDTGHHDVTVRVSDGTVSADQSYSITVQHVNHAPRFTSTPVTLATEDELYVYYVTAVDVDGDNLVFNAPVLPDWLNFDVSPLVLHGMPDKGDAGKHNVSLMVSDGEGTEIQSFIINVEAQSGVGIDDFRSPDFMVVFPIPSDGRVIVELSRELEREIILEILDPMGKVLLQQEYPPYSLIKEEYNMSDRPAGIYFIRVYNDSFDSIRKFLIY